MLVFKAKYRDRIPGGRADNKKPSDFDPVQLRAGTKVELEHTGKRADKKEARAIAREIAMDHLTESPDYYRELARMEAKLEARKKIEKSERKKPYGHVAYTRVDKRTGRIVYVRARGVKPPDQDELKRKLADSPAGTEVKIIKLALPTDKVLRRYTKTDLGSWALQNYETNKDTGGAY